MRFDGKVAVVTGAARGIGEAYARALAAEGASVVVADLDAEGAHRVAEQIVVDGGRALASKVDVGSAESARDLALGVVEAMGGIDLLVNNAALYGEMRIDSLLTVDLDYYRHFLEVNLNGALYMTRACVPAMRSRGGGAIVNQSSTAAWLTLGGYYGLAKAGLNSLTINLAAELGGSNIRVNAVAPGPTDTEATRRVVPASILEPMVACLALKRLGQPADLVGACLFLLSDEARWLTGQIVAVDGGQIARL